MHATPPQIPATSPAHRAHQATLLTVAHTSAPGTMTRVADAVPIDGALELPAAADFTVLSKNSSFAIPPPPPPSCRALPWTYYRSICQVSGPATRAGDGGQPLETPPSPVAPDHTSVPAPAPAPCQAEGCFHSDGDSPDLRPSDTDIETAAAVALARETAVAPAEVQTDAAKVLDDAMSRSGRDADGKETSSAPSFSSVAKRCYRPFCVVVKNESKIGDPSEEATYAPPITPDAAAVVVCGPQITGSFDNVHLPRRVDSTAHTTALDPTATNTSPSASDAPPGTDNPAIELTVAAVATVAAVQQPPTALAPEMHVVLARISSSGLFRHRDIYSGALEFFVSFSPPLALTILDGIQSLDFSTILNKPALIVGIFKLMVNNTGVAPPASAPPLGRYAPKSESALVLAHLQLLQTEELQRIFMWGVCHPRQFDDRAMDILGDLPEGDAVKTLIEFAAMEPAAFATRPPSPWALRARKMVIHAPSPHEFHTMLVQHQHQEEEARIDHTTVALSMMQEESAGRLRRVRR